MLIWKELFISIISKKTIKIIKPGLATAAQASKKKLMPKHQNFLALLVPMAGRKIVIRRRQNAQPIKVKTKLYSHQEEFLKKALMWESRGNGGLLGAEMGTGKTLMILSLFANDAVPKRTLVIAPLALLNNWRNEYIRHLDLPASKVAIYHGPKRYQTRLDNRYMVITTYETARIDIEKWDDMSPLVNDFRPERIVLDEAHEIKNQASKRFKAIVKIPGRLRWAMTGTPIHNYIDDLASLAKFIDVKPYNNNNWWSIASDEEIETWKHDSYIYFSKEGINLKLPEKHSNHHLLKFSQNEEDLYRQMICEAEELFKQYLDGGCGILFTVILTKILRLKQICNHPFGPMSDKMIKEREFNDSTKTTKLIEIINDIPNNEKIIVFSQFRGTLKLIQRSLHLHGYNDQYVVYHGGLNPLEKETVLQQFERDDSKKILLMSIKAGGVGLNLVRANHVVLFDLWWNRAVEEQALARVHRIGQAREVHIHRLSIEKSIEQWVIGIQERKMKLASQVLEGYDVDDGKVFTIEDIKRLFNQGAH